MFTQILKNLAKTRNSKIQEDKLHGYLFKQRLQLSRVIVIAILDNKMFKS